MIKTIILDFDGTVGDTRQCIVSTMQLSFQLMGLPSAEESDIIPLIGLPLVEMYRKLADLDDTQIDKITSIYRDNFSDLAFGNVRSFPHVQDTIKELHNKGYIITIASSRGHHSLLMLMQQLHIENYISIFMSDQDVKDKKPAPEMVIKTLEQTSTQPDEAIVVGDTVYDIEMGQRAGCRTCGVTYGNNTRDDLEAQGADYIINDFAELMDIVETSLESH
jgi:phosphoglycolate phosphatase